MANYPNAFPGYGPDAGYGPVYSGQMMPMPSGQPGGTQPAYICRPVTCREEAVACRVEAFGPGVLMPDFGHGTIYFKRFNTKTALADFGEFRYVPPQETAAETTAPAAAPDLSALASGFVERLDAMGQKLDEIMGRLDAKPGPKPQKGAAEK